METTSGVSIAFWFEIGSENKRWHVEAGSGGELERFEQGQDLPAHENVEIFGPVTYASNKQFFFRSSEPKAIAGQYLCKPGTYRMIGVVASVMCGRQKLYHATNNANISV